MYPLSIRKFCLMLSLRHLIKEATHFFNTYLQLIRTKINEQIQHKETKIKTIYLIF